VSLISLFLLAGTIPDIGSRIAIALSAIVQLTAAVIASASSVALHNAIRMPGVPTSGMSLLRADNVGKYADIAILDVEPEMNDAS
jgi:hypothetical protein